jgi:GxxExxY protein
MLTNPAGLNGHTRGVIGAAIRVHQETGPGLPESIHTECLVFELRQRGIPVETEVRIPLSYRGTTLKGHYPLDLLVAGLVIVEIKSVVELAPIHTAQLLTYLELTDRQVGLLINFNVRIFKEGIKRVVRAKRGPPATQGRVELRSSSESPILRVKTVTSVASVHRPSTPRL